MTYRLTRCTRITPVAETGTTDGEDADKVRQVGAVLVDSRNFSAHYLTSPAFVVIRAAVNTDEPRYDELIRELGLTLDQATRVVTEIFDEMRRRGWATAHEPADDGAPSPASHQDRAWRAAPVSAHDLV